MQNLFYLLVLILLTSTVLTSCSVEKRVHRSGYYVDWHHSSNSKQKNNRSVVTEAKVENDASEQLADLKLQIPVEAKLARFKDFSQSPAKSSDIEESEKSEGKTKELKRSFNLRELKDVAAYSEVELPATTEINSAESASDSGDALKTIGWVLIILGLVFLLIISILLGALLMLLGLVFVVAAPSSD